MFGCFWDVEDPENKGLGLEMDGRFGTITMPGGTAAKIVDGNAVIVVLCDDSGTDKLEGIAFEITGWIVTISTKKFYITAYSRYAYIYIYILCV